MIPLDELEKLARKTPPSPDVLLDLIAEVRRWENGMKLATDEIDDYERLVKELRAQLEEAREVIKFCHEGWVEGEDVVTPMRRSRAYLEKYPK